MSDYPFKKKNKKEFQWLNLITLVSTFNSIIDNQNADNNNSNDNRICDTNPMINSNWDAQSSDWSISKQTRKEI